MKKCVVRVVLALAVNSVLGMDGIEYLKQGNWADVVSVTSTNLTLKIKNDYFYISQDDSNRKVLEEAKTNVWAQLGRWSSEFKEKGETLVLTPDQGTRFSEDHGRVTFKPVSFKSQHKGFRVTSTGIGAGSYKRTPDIMYIVLSDTPMEAGEDDVEMVMDNGEWVNAEDSKSLTVEKLGWVAELYIARAEAIRQNPAEMARIFGNPESARIWNALVENGLIKTNAEPLPAIGEDRGASHTPGGGATTAPVAAPVGQTPNAPTANNPAPWKLPLLIGALAVGGVAGWRYLRKRKQI
ncbi:MAG: hypothetical protein FWH21_05830 [Kiritimatiellaeota bacterium]|nr:hypothetical protein [Kiritimatiellota bacterium]